MTSHRPWPPTVSVVVAAHDEEACLPELLGRVHAVLARSVDAYEIVVIDDGSNDRTLEVIEAAAAADPRVRGARLSQNEGHQAALLCGLARAHGDVVITIDADLQHPPECIPDMLDAWRQGADIVHMQRSDHLPMQARDVAARGFYLLFNSLSATRVDPGSTDFRLLDARCVAPLLAMPSSARFLRAAVRRIGFRQVERSFEAGARHAGRSSYTIRRLIDLGVEAIVGTTHALVVLPLVAGVALVGASLAAFAPGIDVSAGWSIDIALALATGATALALTSVGARAWIVARSAEPLYFVEREIGSSTLLRRAAMPPRDLAP